MSEIICTNAVPHDSKVARASSGIYTASGLAPVQTPEFYRVKYISEVLMNKEADTLKAC